MVRFSIPLLFLIIIIFSWHDLKQNPRIISSPLIDHPAPEFNLPTLFNDKITSQHDFMGHVTLLNVWASWCYVCAEEHEFLLQLSHSNIIQLYGLNYKDDIHSAKAWLHERGNPYEIIAVDESGSTAINWGVYGIPESFIIDKQGVVRYKHIGPINATLWENTLRPLVKQLWNEH